MDIILYSCTSTVSERWAEGPAVSVSGRLAEGASSHRKMEKKITEQEYGK